MKRPSHPKPSPLDEYAAKRAFSATPEPAPGMAERNGPLLFVIQKHGARALHYDVRLEAYERAIEEDAGLLKARINLGCLLHETGRLERAESVYREALRVNGSDPVLLYDLGVLLDDMGRKNEAMDAYRAALREDPGFADCHFNLALLCERLGRPRDAIQHMAAYRRLTATTRSE